MGCRLRRRSLGDIAVIIVSAAAIQANTPFIHTIQADTDDTHDTVIYFAWHTRHTGTRGQSLLRLNVDGARCHAPRQNVAAACGRAPLRRALARTNLRYSKP
jgi:hypothetical protein